MAGRLVALTEVFVMLETCAPGFTYRRTDHHLRIAWNGLVYPDFPLGDHGRGRRTGRTEIFMGHVRSLVRNLGIDRACAMQKINGLYD